MREPKAPTLDELLSEFEKAAKKLTPGGKSTLEWADHWNVPTARARDVIRRAILTGRMATEMELRENVTRPGYRSRVALHRFVKRGKR